jgi:uncharacterized protein involved in type VI secretion and phage assembly
MKYKDLEYEDKSSRIYGVVTALVTNNKDPDGMARVKVKYPWMGEAADKESDWARIATFMAGNERGAYFIPEVDDEVLVAFENGDINFPYIIGALWNGKDKAIEKNDDGKNNIRAFHSRSGHKLVFDDTKDKEKIIIEDKTGDRAITFDVEKKTIDIVNKSGEMTLTLKGKMSVDIEADVEINVKKNIVFNSDEDISFKAKNIKMESSKDTKMKVGAKFDLKASAGFKAASDAKMDFKGSAGVKVDSSGPLDLLAKAPATLKSSAITNVKGSLVKIN